MNSRMRTARGRVEGLGSAKSGTGDFLHQRMTAAILVPLSVWFALAAISHIGGDQASVAAYLGRPVNAVLMFLFVSSMLYHMSIGMQVIIEDYVHQEGMKISFIILNRLLCFAIGAASTLALVKLALSGS